MTFVHLLRVCVNVTCITLSCVVTHVCLFVCTSGHWDDNVVQTVYASVHVCTCSTSCLSPPVECTHAVCAVS